jgi:NAD-dependent histone deacetylase SIR2
MFKNIFLKKAVESNQVPRCKKSNCTDLVKPNIVFFGESLPKRFDLHTQDFSRSDLVIIMGTSLKVPFFTFCFNKIHNFLSFFNY